MKTSGSKISLISPLTLAMWCGAACKYTLALQAPYNTLPPELSQLLDPGAENGRDYEGARKIFREFPAERAQSLALMALGQPQYSQRADTRRMLLEVIASHKGELIPEGRARLMECLSDPAPVIQRMCCDSLSPEEIEREWQRLIAIVTSVSQSDMEREVALNGIMGWGPCVKHHVDAFGNLFRNINEQERLRSFAARGVLNAGGLEEALRQFKDTDSVGAKVASTALAGYIAENDSYGRHLTVEDAKQRPAAIEFVLKALKSPSVETRKEAFTDLGYVAGYDFIIFRSATDYDLNPAIRKTLEEMAASDADPELREWATARLDPERMEKVAQGIIRRRQRESQR